jgi:hypothetical protein
MPDAEREDEEARRRAERAEEEERRRRWEERQLEEARRRAEQLRPADPGAVGGRPPGTSDDDGPYD